MLNINRMKHFLSGYGLFLTYAIPKSSISKMSVDPPGMPGCENLPYPISAGM